MVWEGTALPQICRANEIGWKKHVCKWLGKDAMDIRNPSLTDWGYELVVGRSGMRALRTVGFHDRPIMTFLPEGSCVG